jgi:hypothetical protein
VVLLAAGAFVLWIRSGDTTSAAAGTPTAAPSPSGSAPSGAAPPASTPADDDDGAEDGDAAEEESAEDTAEAPSSPTAAREGGEEADELTAVAVALSYTGYDASAGAVVAGGYADGVVEEDATCTLVLRRDGVELRGESLSTPNVTTTDCGEVRVGGDALTSGTWEAVLGYTSDTSAGQSAVGEVVVP